MSWIYFTYDDDVITTRSRDLYLWVWLRFYKPYKEGIPLFSDFAMVLFILSQMIMTSQPFPHLKHVSGFISSSMRLITTILNKMVVQCFFVFFSIRIFFHRHWRLTGQQGKGGDHLLFHSTTSTRTRTFRHLFATLHVRWLSHIFNGTACICQVATRWDLPPYRITVWLTGDVTLSFCLFTWWF